MTQMPEDPRETQTWEEKKRRAPDQAPPPGPTAAPPSEPEVPPPGPISAVPTVSAPQDDRPGAVAQETRTVGQAQEDRTETARWEEKKRGRATAGSPTEKKRFWRFGRRRDGG